LRLGVQPPVIIDPDDTVTMDRAVAAYDAARLAGADRVLFAARAEQTGGR
jgi:biopolymer transport protein ExbD